MRSSRTVSITGSRTATGYSYRKPCSPQTYSVAVVLAANRAHTNNWADAQVEGGCARQTVQLPFHSSRFPTAREGVKDAAQSAIASLSRRVPNNAGPRAAGAPMGGCGGGKRIRVWDPRAPTTPTHDWSSRVTLRIGEAADGFGFLDSHRSLRVASE